MFSLFELAKVLHFAKNGEKGSIKLLSHACEEDNGHTLVALYFSNGYLLLWYSHTEKPTIGQMAWFRNRHILCMCFDTSASWLLCCVRDALVIVPALYLLKNGTHVEYRWPIDDVTQIRIERMRGQPMVCRWWKAYNQEPVAIFSTDAGYLYLINLSTKQVIHELHMEDQISNLALVRDQQSSSILIITKSNVLWTLLLEQTVDDSHLPTASEESCSKQRHAANIYHQKHNYISIMDKNGDIAGEMVPKQLYHFPPSVFLSTQQVKCSTYVTTYDLYTNVLQIYHINMERSPCGVYHLPDTTDHVLITEKLLFLTSFEKSNILSVASNQLAEVAPIKNDKNQAVIQQFYLPKNENILCLYKKEKFPPTNNLSKQMHCDEWIPDECVRMLPEGCVLLTDKALYICRLRISPVVLFINLSCRDTKFKEAEMLADILGFDTDCLYKAAAERSLRDANYTTAMTFLNKIKCSDLCQLELLLKCGCVDKARRVLSSLKNKKETSNCSLTKCNKLIAQYALICYVCQIAMGHSEVKEELRNFLCANCCINPNEVLCVLLKCGLHSYFVDFALKQNALHEAVMILLNPEIHCRHEDMYPYNKVNLPYCSINAKQITDDLLQLLDASLLLELIKKDCRHAIELTSAIEQNLSELPDHQLIKVIYLLDFSKPAWARWCLLVVSKEEGRSLVSRHKEISGHQDISAAEAFKCLLRLLLISLVYLNKKRISEGCYQFQANYPHLKLSQDNLQECVCTKPTLLCCDVDFTAMIISGDLYTWGCVIDGKLGHDDLSTTYVSTPHKVKLFQTLGIQVISVACGRKHCLALAENGVYAWGSNTYGQLGTNCQSSVPVRIQCLDIIQVANVICGQYHSLVLTPDFRVYSWGWGVHGQLGHGDPEDRYEPKQVKALQAHKVVMVTAGSTHTAVLTAQGLVYAFGDNTFGQLGTGRTSKSTHPEPLMTFEEPIVIITTKYFHTLALSQSGKLYCWGVSPLQLRHLMVLLRQTKSSYFRKDNQLFNKFLLPSEVNRECIQGQIVKLCCGNAFSAVLSDTGDVYTWGLNGNGELATGDKIDEPAPIKVRKLKDIKIVNAAAGCNFMITIDSDGSLHSWGSNDYGQLGVNPRNPGLIGKRASNKSQALLGRPRLRTLINTNDVLEPIQINIQASTEVREPYNAQFVKDEAGREWWLEKLCWLPSSVLDVSGSQSVLQPCHAITQILRHLSKWGRLEELFDICVRLQVWDVAAVLSSLQNKYSLAFQYDLKFLASMRTQLGMQFEDTLLNCLCHYVVLLSESNIETLVNFCTSIVVFWDAERLSVAELQQFVEKYQHVLALPFIMSLIEVEKQIAFESSFLFQTLCEAIHLVDISGCVDIKRSFCKGQKNISSETVNDNLLPNETNVSEEANAELRNKTSQDIGRKSAMKNLKENSVDALLVFSCGHNCVGDVFCSVPESECKLVSSKFTLKQIALHLVNQCKQQSKSKLLCPECTYRNLMELLQIGTSSPSINNQ